MLHNASVEQVIGYNVVDIGTYDTLDVDPSLHIGCYRTCINVGVVSRRVSGWCGGYRDRGAWAKFHCVKELYPRFPQQYNKRLALYFHKLYSDLKVALGA